MDVVLLSRIQFALTIGFHYIYPPMSIGLGVIMVMAESMFMWTAQERYRIMARFWTRIFALTFSIGVATGIVMEFEFGTNWANYSRFVGDIFGSALGAEGIFAFFLESGFLALLIFGWDRIGAKFHYFSTWMVCLGAHFSAVWIVVANSWMQTPAGYHLVEHPMGVRAEITDFWQMVFNPSSVDRLTHTLLGAWLVGAFLVISVSAWYVLRGRHLCFARDSLRLAIPFATITLLCSALSGHESAVGVAENQPTKLAAFEGIYETQDHAPLTIVGWLDTTKQEFRGISLPGALSYFIYGDVKAPVKGLKEYPLELWPPVQLSFQAYHLMIALWFVMVMIMAWTWMRWKIVFQPPSTRRARLHCYALIFSIVLPMLANQVGWMAAEVGRQPWVVWGLLKTRDGVSKTVDAPMVMTSLIVFTAIYFLLFILFIFLLDRKIRHGPEASGSEEYRDFLNFHKSAK